MVLQMFWPRDDSCSGVSSFQTMGENSGLIWSLIYSDFYLWYVRWTLHTPHIHNTTLTILLASTDKVQTANDWKNEPEAAQSDISDSKWIAHSNHTVTEAKWNAFHLRWASKTQTYAKGDAMTLTYPLSATSRHIVRVSTRPPTRRFALSI